MKDYFFTIEHNSLIHMQLDVWKMKLRLYKFEDTDKDVYYEIGFADLTLVDTSNVDIFQKANSINSECIFFAEFLYKEKRYPFPERIVSFLEKIYLMPDYQIDEIIRHIIEFIRKIPFNDSLIFSSSVFVSPNDNDKANNPILKINQNYRQMIKQINFDNPKETLFILQILGEERNNLIIEKIQEVNSFAEPFLAVEIFNGKARINDKSKFLPSFYMGVSTT